MQRVAVIGMGNIGNRHAAIYDEMDGAKLCAVCDVDGDRARAAAERFAVPAYESVADLLANTALEAVSVTTGGYEYGSDHFEPTMQALDAGLHVLCEKPICNEIDKAVQMVAKAEAADRCFAINLNHRFTPAAVKAKEWVDEGRLGQLLFVNMSMWILNPNESSPWFQIKALHPHTVDIMRYYCGDIEAVHCFASKGPGRSIWSNAQFNMRFRNGVIGSLCGSYDMARGHPMERCEVAGSGGRFVIEDMFRELTLYPADSLEKRVYSNPIFGGMRDFGDTFRNRLASFVTELNNGVAPADIDGSGADGLAAQRVLAAAILSIQEERVVKVEEVG